MEQSAKTLVSWTFVLFAVASFWTWAAMLVDGQPLPAEFLFVLANIMLGARFVFVFGEARRQTYIGITLQLWRSCLTEWFIGWN